MKEKTGRIVENKSSRTPCRMTTLSLDIFKLLTNALQSKKRRRFLYFLIFLLLFSGILDGIGSSYAEFFGAVGFAGLSIYLGRLLHSAIPQNGDKYFYCYLVGIVWVILGVGVILTYLMIKAMTLVGLLP